VYLAAGSDAFGFRFGFREMRLLSHEVLVLVHVLILPKPRPSPRSDLQLGGVDRHRHLQAQPSHEI